jgi:cytochrome c biogenesis factor
MAAYRISGVWTGTNGAITHYAMHTAGTNNTVALAIKTSKADAIKLVEATSNTVTTMVWNATSKAWHTGETVTVVGSGSSKYLRSNPDNSLTDNLDHLPNFSLNY